MSSPAIADAPTPTAFNDPVVRNYVFVGLASLLVLFAVLAQKGDLTAALLPVLVASLGLFFHWPGTPIAFLVLTGYLFVFPYGLPTGVSPFSDLPGSAFRVGDVLAAYAVLIYCVCQYRVFSLTGAAVPADVPGSNAKNRLLAIRPSDSQGEHEVERMFIVAAGCVFVGQLLWLLLTTFKADPTAFPPIRYSPEVAGPSRSDGASLPPAAGRVLLLGGMVVLGGFAARTAFWLWRANRYTPDEGRMVLLDTGWTESRRELNRPEVWRAAAAPGGIRKPPPPPPRRPRSILGWIAFLIWAFCVGIVVFGLLAWYLWSGGIPALLGLLGFGLVLAFSKRLFDAPLQTDPHAKSLATGVRSALSWGIAGVLGLTAVGALAVLWERENHELVIALVTLAVGFIVYRKFFSARLAEADEGGSS